MIIRGGPKWTLLGTLILCLCMAQASYAVLVVAQQANEEVSNIFVLDTRDTTVLYGDVSDNGEVTSYDASLILQHTVLLTVLAGRDSVAADVSGEGGISALDASLVLQYAVGKIAQFPVEGGALPRSVASSRTAGIPRIGHTPEGHLEVPVGMDGMAGVFSGEVAVSYDPDSVEVLSVTPLPPLSEYLVEQNVRDGTALISFAGADAKIGSGEIMVVTFRPLRDMMDAVYGIRLAGVQLNEGRIAVELANEGMPDVPVAYALYSSFPNPFNPETTIRYGTPVPGRIDVVIYNLAGQKVRDLVSGVRDAGVHAAVWDGRDDRGRAVASGVYLCRLVAGRHADTRRLVLVK